MSTDLEVGDRVQHVAARLTGTVTRTVGEYVYVRWDYPALAISALGHTANMQRREYLEPEFQDPGMEE